MKDTTMVCPKWKQEVSKMSSIKIKVMIQVEDIIEIDVDDLIHQSIDDYMDDVIDNPSDYLDIMNGIDWQVA